MRHGKISNVRSGWSEGPVYKILFRELTEVDVFDALKTTRSLVSTLSGLTTARCDKQNE